MRLPHLELGDFHAARADLETHLSNVTSVAWPHARAHANAYCLLGRSLAKIGDVRAARTAFDNAIRLAPSDADNRKIRGWFLMENGQNESALEDLQIAAIAIPDDGQLIGYRAIVYYRLKCYELAAKDFTNCIALNYATAWSHSWRARAYLQIDELQLALSDCKCVDVPAR